METCDCGAVEFRKPPCACVPCHEPKPFSSMNRSSCVIHGPEADHRRESFMHADKLVECPDCYEPYGHHALDDEPWRWLTVLCDGTRVKL